MTRTFDSILLSDAAVKESRSAPTTTLAFLISLLSLLASATLSLLPQHTTANRMVLATTDSKNILSIVQQMLKERSLLRK